MTGPPPVADRTLREVARLRRAEIDREADRALLEAEHDVELLERLQSLRTPPTSTRRLRDGWQNPGDRRAA